MFEIYKRINSGGENLNDQQARKAAFWWDTPVTSAALLSFCANANDFKILGRSVPLPMTSIFNGGACTRLTGLDGELYHCASTAEHL